MAGLTGTDPGEDVRWMERALELAARGWGQVFPNPMVGAVIVNRGRVVGEGAHRQYGGPHAEVRALEAAGRDAAGATLYVTLEPCAHHGKTPPCTRAIVGSGVRRVVAACRDPDPEAAGGIDELREAGLEVETGVGGDAARHLNARFLWSRIGDQPFVLLKYGLSLDGRLARKEGEQTAVTGRDARAYVHWLRAGFEAVLVGRRTVEVDDPRLTPRGRVTPRQMPRRVVLDPSLRTPPASRLVATAGEIPVWVVAASGASTSRRRALEANGVRVLVAEAEAPHRLRPASVLAVLGSEGVRTLLVEGGGRVGSSFLRADVVDRLALLRAPDLFGDQGVPAFRGPAPEGRGRWTAEESRQLGRDHLWVLDRSRTSRRIREAS